jgi:acyl transferase domain-containing protein
LERQIPTRAIIWPTKGLRRASVNSFGASGTNAHAVLDDVYHTLCRLSLQGNHNTVAEPSVNSSRLPAFLPAASDSSSNHSRILFLSASNKATLPHMINQFSHWLSERKASGDITATLVDQLVYTLAERRSSLPWKSFALLRTGEVTSDLSSRMSLSIRSQENPKLGFVFTGQGAQWCGMGKELLNFPLFLDSILESQEYLETLGFAGSLTSRSIPLEWCFLS